MKDPKEIVAVKCEGGFTEWYSPFYKEPYEDNAEYRAYYNEHILDVQPVIGPSLNEEDDDECIQGDLGCLSDRMMSAYNDWKAAKAVFEEAVCKALASGDVQTIEYEGDTIKITPYRRGQMPKPNENHLKVYGSYADLIRERVAAI